MWGVLIFGACPVALWIGDLTALERYVEILLDYSTRYALQFFRALGRCFQGLLLIKRGGITSKLAGLPDARIPTEAFRRREPTLKPASSPSKR
jgi:hypothetical protein